MLNQNQIGLKMEFSHAAMDLSGDLKLVYSAMSKHLFYYRMFISKYILANGYVPLNPFMIFDYFMLDTVDRDLIRRGNNSLVLRADEIWVFGPISNGVLSEILLAKKTEKNIRYFEVEKPHKIQEIDTSKLRLEEDITDFKKLLIS